jgi:ParB-like chromosome segregation protein Spo0J
VQAIPEVHLVPAHSLVLGESPRLSGIDDEHVARLAECEEHLPPIMVHRQTMQVIDGAHRLHAAIRTGHELVRVTYFDGGAAEAFMLSVELNVRHGLPLSLQERRAAAGRILAAGTDLSDRALAARTGLSDKTVAAIRRRSGAEIPHLDTRRGRDGRVYPVRATGGQRAGQERSAAGPGSSGLHGKRAARRVRDRQDTQAVLAQLRSDPSVRGREAGRDLLRWLHTHAIGIEDLPECEEAIPPHCAVLVAGLAQQVGDAWLELARRIEAIERELGALGHQAQVS